MTNNERIKANNAGLREAIELAENLPDAGAEADPYDGSYTVTPKIDEQTMPTKNKLMLENVTIKSIPFFNVSNTSGGSTVYIGNEV